MRPAGYYDGACSYSIVNQLTLLHDVRLLTTPSYIDGVGGRIALTHMGRLSCLPSIDNMNIAYFSKDAPTNLLSLGHLQRCGAFYSPDPVRPRTHFILRISQFGPVLATVPLSSNNLLPVDFAELRISSLRHALPHATANIPRLGTRLRSLLSQKHHTAEQLRRADAAEELHYDRNHPSDDSLCADLSHGKIPWSPLTCHDVRLNRLLRGPCVHCAAGKLTEPPSLTSTTAPATACGAVVSFDVHMLPDVAPGGHTHALHTVDEFSGRLDVVGATSKSTTSVARAVRSIIAEYNSHSHRVGCMHGDPEKINASLFVPLSTVGTKLQLSLPGAHAKRIERYERTINERSTATLSALPYWLPSKYTLFLHKAVASILNDSINTQSFPLTPNEIFTGRKQYRPSLRFGRSSMVSQAIDKRRTLANTYIVPINHIPKAEVGVSMGPDPFTGHTLFLLANGLIVPRRIRTILPASFVPFNWVAKEYHISSPSLPASTADPPVAELQISPQNSAIQLPDLPLREAISILTNQVPEALPQDTLASLRQTSNQIPQLPEITASMPDSINASSALTPGPLLHAEPEVMLPPPSIVLPPPAAMPILSTSLATQQLPPSPQITTATTSHRFPSRLRSNQHLTNLYNSEIDFRQRKSISKHTAGAAALISAAIERKLQASRLASQRNRQHIIDTNPIQSLNNRSTKIIPQPPPPRRSEMSIAKAIQQLGPELTRTGIAKEFTKIFDTYQSLKPIAWSDIEPDAVFLRSQMLMKKKLDDRVTGRLAIDGSRQPSDTYQETFAGTSCTTNRAFILSCVLADSAHHHKLHKLQIGDFDIPGAFLQNRLPRSATGGRQFYTKLPHDIPLDLVPKGTRYAEITGAMYGTKQANAIYDKDFTATIRSAGYDATPEDPHTFVKRCPTDATDYLILNTHVDDGQFFSTSIHLTNELETLLKKRYGEDVPFRRESEGICGVRLTRHPNHDVTLDMKKHIMQSVLPKCGMDKLPPALTPSMSNFFDPPSDTTPANATEYLRANGCLIHLLPIRHDIRKEVVHLCTRNKSPTKSDRDKQIHVLRYLKGCPDLGITFSANPDSFPQGVVITGAADTSHACHVADGKSHTAYIICIGTENAPFVAFSSAEPSGIAVSPCESEYVGLSRLAISVVFFRSFAESLGFPQPEPSILYEDNKSAINLTTTPELPKRSRHILQRHHVIRFLYLSRKISPVHQGTHDIIPDGMTKTLGPTAFLFFRFRLMRPPRRQRT